MSCGRAALLALHPRRRRQPMLPVSCYLRARAGGNAHPSWAAAAGAGDGDQRCPAAPGGLELPTNRRRARHDGGRVSGDVFADNEEAAHGGGSDLMADTLTRTEYCVQCGDNLTMWYRAELSAHIIGCRRCGAQQARITDRELATLGEDEPIIRRFYWMGDHGRTESTRAVRERHARP